MRLNKNYLRQLSFGLLAVCIKFRPITLRPHLALSLLFWGGVQYNFDVICLYYSHLSNEIQEAKIYMSVSGREW